MTLEQRIEAAAKARAPYQWSLLTADEQAVELAYAEAAIRAGFPEFFTSPPEAWIAPWEATRAMGDAAANRPMSQLDTRQSLDFAAMRDAHLRASGLDHGAKGGEE